MSTFNEVVLAFRPKTLTAAFAPILVGTALSLYFTKNANWLLMLLALAASICIQIATNLINDAKDFQKGADTAERIGPKRITASGVLSDKAVLRLGFGFFALAILLAIPLVMAGGWVIVLIGVFSILAGYAYTAGPFPFAYHGFGDGFVILFFGLVATAGTFFLNSKNYEPAILIAGLQIGFLAAVLIAINNLRDIHTDRPVGKRTLPVRFGENFAKAEIAFLAFAPFLLNLYWFKLSFFAATLPFLCLPVASKLVFNIYSTSPSPVYNKFLAKAALLHSVFGLLLSIGFLIK